MPENILVGVAWPYANGSLHLGQIAGRLPAAGHLRALPPPGGQPRADGLRHRPARHADHRPRRAGGHDAAGGRRRATTRSSCDCWERLGISFDLFTTTGTENHDRDGAGHLPASCCEQGDIYNGTMELSYCAQEGRFLPDRYVEGTCPHCGYEDARGDQCDNCGTHARPDRADQPALPASTARRRSCATSEHFFLRLSAFNEPLTRLAGERQGALAHARAATSRSACSTRACTTARSRATSTGACRSRSRASTSKRIYVWFEAVIGYLSAAKEWAQQQGTPDAWRDFWQDPAAKTYYFIGKDNIRFHTLIWPAHGCMMLRRPQPALRRAGQPVRQLRRRQGEHEPRHGAVPAGLPRALRPRPAALLPRGDHAGDQRHRVQRGRPRRAATTTSWSRPGATSSTAC